MVARDNAYIDPILMREHKYSSSKAFVRRFQSRPPIDVKAIADDLGIRVWEMHNLLPNISGKLFPDPRNGGSSGYSIGVNAAESFVRKRFTIAHELAHFLLHREQVVNGITEDVYYRGGLSTRDETEANYLAADILMPMHLINQLQAQGVRDVDEIARMFQVSSIAMKIRLGIPVL
jgi:IrrE N-terminal-like domain